MYRPLFLLALLALLLSASAHAFEATPPAVAAAAPGGGAALYVRPSIRQSGMKRNGSSNAVWAVLGPIVRLTSLSLSLSLSQSLSLSLCVSLSVCLSLSLSISLSISLSTSLCLSVCLSHSLTARPHTHTHTHTHTHSQTKKPFPLRWSSRPSRFQCSLGGQLSGLILLCFTTLDRCDFHPQS